jgi:hypothetical protein
MENKTPMQELREIRLKSFDAMKFVEFFDENYFELLKKEKRVITGAYNQSTYQFANNAEVINPISAKDYYNEKFNNDVYDK